MSVESTKQAYIDRIDECIRLVKVAADKNNALEILEEYKETCKNLDVK